MWERPKVSPVLAQHSTYTAKGGIYKDSHWQMWHGIHYHPQRFVVHLLRPPRSPVELEGLVLHFRRALHIAPYGTPEKAIIQSLEQFVLVLAIDSVLIFEAMLVWEPCCLHRPSACRSRLGQVVLGGGGQISDEISPDLLIVSSDHTSEPSPSKKEISAAVKRWQSLTALVWGVGGTCVSPSAVSTGSVVAMRPWTSRHPAHLPRTYANARKKKNPMILSKLRKIPNPNSKTATGTLSFARAMHEIIPMLLFELVLLCLCFAAW